MDLAGLSGLLQNRHEQITHALQFYFARPARLGPGDERINTAPIE
jgi:hypothetical protein